MKYYSKLKMFKNSTESCVFDVETQTGISYNTIIYKDGIFNNSFFSMTTRKHQSKLLKILNNQSNIIIIDNYPIYNSKYINIKEVINNYEVEYSKVSEHIKTKKQGTKIFDRLINRLNFIENVLNKLKTRL